MKPKLLAWCDFVVPTGFANVAKNLLDDMYQEYDVTVLGINFYGNDRYDTSKYFVYPVNQPDILGVNKLFSIIKKEQPDLLFLFQDIFHISDFIDKLRTEFPSLKIVTYFPVDGAPFSKAWGNALDKCDTLITYSDWAIDTIKQAFPNIKKPLHKLYHGVDFSSFFLLPEPIVDANRAKHGWSDKFIVSNVNRFQPRKAIPTSVRAYSMFALGYQECSKCGNKMPWHLTRCDLNGCEEKYLIKKGTKKSDVFYYLHMMPTELVMGPGRTNSLPSHLVNAGFINADSHSYIGFNARDIYKGDVTEQDVNLIYNMSNVNLSTTLGEGCGLSLLEAQAAGTPSIAPNNSAIPEMLNGTGTLVSNETVYSLQGDNAIVRPIVSAFEVMLALEKYYNEWIANGKKKIIYQECIDNVKTNFQWEDKRALLKKLFKETLESK